MAISWVLRDERVTSALMGASRWSQIEEALGALDNTGFTDEELALIDSHAVDGDLNLWAASSEAG
jgi:L-glyceraldehyde 3-phosphate reductase